MLYSVKSMLILLNFINRNGKLNLFNGIFTGIKREKMGIFTSKGGTYELYEHYHFICRWSSTVYLWYADYGTRFTECCWF